MKYIIIIVILVVLVIWMFSVRRRLAGMNDNINNAMNQIGVQMDSRFDALQKLLALVEKYAPAETAALNDMIKSGVCITAVSSPDEVVREDAVLSEALAEINAIAEKYPDLKNDETYGKCMYAVVSYGKMVGTSTLIYNDTVARMNRDLRFIPVALVGGLFGYHRRPSFKSAGQN